MQNSEKLSAIKYVICAIASPFAAYHTYLEQPERSIELATIAFFTVTIFSFTVYRVWNNLGWPRIQYFSYFFVFLLVSTALSVSLEAFGFMNGWVLLLCLATGILVSYKYGKQYREWYRSSICEQDSESNNTINIESRT